MMFGTRHISMGAARTGCHLEEPARRSALKLEVRERRRAKTGGGAMMEYGARSMENGNLVIPNPRFIGGLPRRSLADAWRRGVRDPERRRRSRRPPNLFGVLVAPGFIPGRGHGTGLLRGRRAMTAHPVIRNAPEARRDPDHNVGLARLKPCSVRFLMPVNPALKRGVVVGTQRVCWSPRLSTDASVARRRCGRFSVRGSNIISHPCHFEGAERLRNLSRTSAKRIPAVAGISGADRP